MNRRLSQGVRRSWPASSIMPEPRVPAITEPSTRACGSGQPARP